VVVVAGDEYSRAQIYTIIASILTKRTMPIINIEPTRLALVLLVKEPKSY
jgi:hypothetical protein